MAARRNRDGQALSLFADVLREARHKAGLSSDELGEKLGYSGAIVALAIPWKCGDFLLPDFCNFSLVDLIEHQFILHRRSRARARVPSRAPGGAGPGLPA